jgi:hypothetical protein
MEVVAVVWSLAGLAVDDEGADVASVCADAWLHAAIVSAAIRVRVLMSLWRQVAVKPISPRA